MLIKYKGQTSTLLSELSIEMEKSVNLKAAETILSVFFYRILKTISLEAQIQIISSLPAHIKPFCNQQPENNKTVEELFHPSKCTNTMQRTYKILEKYLPQDKQDIIHSSIPHCIVHGNSISCHGCRNKSEEFSKL